MPCSSKKVIKSVSNAMLVLAEHGFLGLLLHYKFKVHHVLKFTGFFSVVVSCGFFLEVFVLVFHSFLHPSPCVIYNRKEAQVIYFYTYTK